MIWKWSTGSEGWDPQKKPQMWQTRIIANYGGYFWDACHSSLSPYWQKIAIWKWGKIAIGYGNFFFCYSRFHKCWNEVFFKIMTKTSLVQKKTIPYMKAKLILIGEKTKKHFILKNPKTQKPKPPKIVIFQLHQYPIYHFGTIFKILSMQSFRDWHHFTAKSGKIGVNL